MSLPPGATLVSGSIPDASQLPPGATLVSGDLPKSSEAPKPGLLDKANEYAAKALSGAGLPTSLSNVPDWFKHLTGTHPDSQPFWAPIREAIKNPTQENIVNAVPFIGPSSVAMSKDVRAGNYGGAAATLAGTVGSAVLPTKAPEIAGGLSDTAQAIRDTPGAISDAAQNGLRDPITGKIKPGVKTAAKVVGGVAGAIPGALHGNLPAAYIGGEAGARTLPAVVDAITPSSKAIEQLNADAAAMRMNNLRARVAESKAAEAAGQTVPEYRAAQKSAAKANATANLSDLAGVQPSGVSVLPEPRALFPGETPNYMASVPRGTLQDLALAGKPGAAKQIQQLGGQVLFAPPGAGISNVKSAVALRDLLEAKPNMTLNPVGAGGARPIVNPADQFEASFGPEHQEVGDLAEWETGNREGVKVGSDLDKAAKSIFGGKSFADLEPAQKAHILRIAQTQVAVP